MTLRCPAKINEFLAVGPPDERGYHPLRTAFRTVGLYDVLRWLPGGSGVEFSGEEVPPENTVTRTLSLLAEVATLPPGGWRIEKGIPSRAGLGGASTDAAGVLRAARRLAPEVPESELRRIAAAVGADVPFFLLGGRARGEGYGEILTPLPDGPPGWAVIAKPEVDCPTPAMYRALDALGDRPFADWGEGPYNDFERVAPCECLDLIEALGPTAGLSGSGSAVYALFGSREEAERAASRVGRAPFVRVVESPA